MCKKILQNILSKKKGSELELFIGNKINSHIFDTNIEEDLFYKLLNQFNNNNEKKYNSYYSYKYYNDYIDIYMNNDKSSTRKYFTCQNYNTYDVMRKKKYIHDIIAINFNKKSLLPTEFPSNYQYHHKEFCEKITIVLNQQIDLDFILVNNNNYKIIIKLNDTNNLDIDYLSNLLNSINEELI